LRSALLLALSVCTVRSIENTVDTVPVFQRGLANMFECVVFYDPPPHTHTHTRTHTHMLSLTHALSVTNIAVVVAAGTQRQR
jgi:hypothetical protein